MNYNRSEDNRLVVSLPLTSKLSQFGKAKENLDLLSLNNSNLLSDVRVQGEKADVKIENLLMNSLKIEVGQGNVDVQAVRLNNCEISTADDIKVVGLFSPHLDRIHLKSTSGLVEVIECRCSELMAIGRSVKVWNCFNSVNKIKATFETAITNLLGCTAVEASGEKVQISGIAGTFNALLSAKSNSVELIMVHDHANEIQLNNPDAKLFLSCPSRIINKLTKILINAKPEVITQSGDDIVLDRVSEEMFEIVRSGGGESESTLNVKVIEGKEVQLHKQSWIDGFSWIKKIFG